MPNYVTFKHKESGLMVNCHQVDKILLNHFNALFKDDLKEWYMNWYPIFAPLLAAGYSVGYIIDSYVMKNAWSDVLEIVRIGRALQALFDIDCHWTR